MRVEFELVNREMVRIIGIDGNEKRNSIGLIFTPSGTGVDNLNAIQVCGFKEAFDLWGCGRFAYPKLKHEMEYEKDKNGRRIMQYAKDIQLMFDDESTPDVDNMKWHENCTGCFNNPCTCERIIKFDNPYTVKREQDLKLLEKANGDKVKTKIRMLGSLEDER
jgi:hypothetical protein